MESRYGYVGTHGHNKDLTTTHTINKRFNFKMATFTMGTNLIPYTSNVPNESTMLIRGSKCNEKKKR